MTSPTIDGLPTEQPPPSNPTWTRSARRLSPAWVILAGCVSVLCAYLTISSYLQNQVDLGAWGCRMSWMSPNYVRLDGPSGLELKGLNAKYALWLYREGGLQTDLTPTGTPVLFIPGNAGSFKQVRSIASSAAHQYHERLGDHESSAGTAGTIANPADWKELDFFATDFNEEFSAFHSRTLEDQSFYVSHAIQYILDLYPAQSPAPQSIILVGHSMGGIVARHAVTRLKDPSVSAIITMSTPHLIPPVTFERGMQDVYDHMDAFWKAGQLARSSKKGHPLPVLVSICGGTADTQISSDSCALEPQTIERAATPASPGNSTDRGTFAVFTTGMEGIWTGVDHQAMVWCDQVRRMVATTLLDMSTVSQDQSASSTALSRVKVTEIARRRFLGERDAQQLHPKPVDHASVNLRGAVSLVADSPNFRHPGPEETALVAQVPSNATRLQIIGDMRVNGVGRTGGSDMSIFMQAVDPQRPGHHTYRGIPLTGIRVLPKSAPFSGALQREGFPLPGEGVKDEDFMLYVEAELKHELGKEQKIVVRLSGAAWGAIAFVTPKSESPVRNGWKPIRQSHTFDSVSDNALILHELRLHRSARCTHSESILFSPIVEHVSHSNPATHESRFYPQAAEDIKVHTHTSAAPYIKEPASGVSRRGMTVNLWQDPRDACGARNVTVRVDWIGSFGLMVMRYRMTILAWTMGIAALVAAIQFRHYRLTVVNFILYTLTRILRVGLGWTGILRFPRSLDAQQHFHPRHAVSVIVLVLLVKLLVPHQLAFIVGFIVHLLSTSTAEVSKVSRHVLLGRTFDADAAQIQSSNTSCLNLYRTLLVFLFMLVPANAAVLFVWVRNLLVLFDKPSGTSPSVSRAPGASSVIRQSTMLGGRDHAIWQIVAVLVIVEACSAGKMPDVSVKL
ncbi:hypothetical protein QFC21_001620 [Naganishia friedmannii]|uniref:Uncharacterized protein n=1 Tax=Naganishia friedmannii TaxID=89922 RepID=A0ACC2W1Z9_9TREE|nr:hypothetical protein QFC21_001620 [Naganishia friedmannii]